jgi:hypothetical protein
LSNAVTGSGIVWEQKPGEIDIEQLPPIGAGKLSVVEV